MAITKKYRKFFQTFTICFCLINFLWEFNLDISNIIILLYYYYVCHFTFKRASFERVGFDLEVVLSLFFLRAHALPPFWIPSKLCTNVIILWELFCVCSILSLFSLLKKFRAIIYRFWIIALPVIPLFTFEWVLFQSLITSLSLSSISNPLSSSGVFDFSASLFTLIL